MTQSNNIHDYIDNSLNNLNHHSNARDFDVLIYHKFGKYPYVNEQDDNCDILKKLTGLKASAGAVVLPFFEEKFENPISSRGAIFVDGRYKLAAKLAVDPAKFEILDYGILSMIRWIKAKIPFNSTIAYDPRFYSVNFIKTIKTKLSEHYKFKLINLQRITNLFPAVRELKIHRIEKKCCENKMSYIYNVISNNKLDAYLLCDPCSISWLLDIRDFESQFSPIVFGYLLVKKNFEAVLYLDDLYSKVLNPSECSAAAIKSEKDLYSDLKECATIGIDERETPSSIVMCNNNNNESTAPKFVNESNSCIAPKARKSRGEIEDVKRIAKLDSAAIINLLYWIHHNYDSAKRAGEKLTELQIASKLIEFRSKNQDYVGDSFACISAADEHSAIIHYSPSGESNAVLNNILLLDTGGQYKYGTTDITRTICLRGASEKEKLFYTLVLKGHIAIASAKFPEGYAMSQLEALARQFLWRYSADYPHGTSHGIGYMLHVHEMLSPDSKGTNLYPGMIISNEPGYYKSGEFGVRLENMMLVKEHSDGFMSFETISLVPFDKKFINYTLLTAEETNWISNYYENIEASLKGLLSDEVFRWLKTQYIR